MSSNGEAVGTSAVATNAGKVVHVPDLAVPANRIYGFVERFRKEYFEDHSLDWCLDQVISRGCAEIERQVKTARERARQKAAGDLQKEFNLTLTEAKQALAMFVEEQRKAQAQQTKS